MQTILKQAIIRREKSPVERRHTMTNMLEDQLTGMSIEESMYHNILDVMMNDYETLNHRQRVYVLAQLITEVMRQQENEYEDRSDEEAIMRALEWRSR
jgi:hypothetical protein